MTTHRSTQNWYKVSTRVYVYSIDVDIQSRVVQSSLANSVVCYFDAAQCTAVFVCLIFGTGLDEQLVGLGDEAPPENP